MNSFIQRHAESVLGVLSGFDRVRIRGTLRWLCYTDGVGKYLSKLRVPLKEFKAFVERTTRQLRIATERLAASSGRPVRYLTSSSVSKEALARQIAERDGVRDGLVCVLSCVEPCWSYEVGWDAPRRLLQLRRAQRKCLHYYHYLIHPEWGFMHARLQTWMPYSVNVWINGREWLARQMDRAGLGYARRENCFVQVQDMERAQALMNEQLRVNWKPRLDALVPQFDPDHAVRYPESSGYYWSVDESEWATDVMFRTPEALAALYPRLIRHGMSVLGSREVMRFLGRKVPVTHGGINGRFEGEVTTDLRTRPEGMRIKHRLNRNSIKMYDKQGSVLRIETTVVDAEDIKVFRPSVEDPTGPRSWRTMRKAVADVYRRAEVCQAANARYLEALAVVQSGTALGELAEPLCRPATWKRRRARALNPLSSEDAALLAVVSRGEFAVHGFRNRDVRGHLYGETINPRQKRRQSAAVTRKLRLLRAHGLIRKVSGTHRYLLTTRGRIVVSALLSARAADTAKLTDAA